MASSIAALTGGEAAAVWIPITQLMPWEKNPRRNEKAVDRVAESIRKFGFGAPIVARKANNQIIAGHTRMLAAQKLGMDKVPVRYLDLDGDDAKLLALADNKLGEIAEWADDQLALVLEEMKLAGVDLNASGFSDAEVNELLAELALSRMPDEEEEIPPLPKKPESERGRVYKLGPHRLMCGDSTSAEDMATLMEGEQASLLWTDPPYNVDYSGGPKPGAKRSKGEIQNDAMPAAEFAEFLAKAMKSADSSMAPGAGFYIAHTDFAPCPFRGAIAAVGWKFSECLIWRKDVLVIGRADYHHIHEPILYGWKSGAAHHAVKDRKQTTVWDVDRPKRSDEHPTMKPVALVERAIRNSSKAGAIVLDPFGGSGTTLIASARTGRVCRTMELDPAYCDVIRQRWARWISKTGDQA